MMAAVHPAPALTAPDEAVRRRAMRRRAAIGLALSLAVHALLLLALLPLRESDERPGDPDARERAPLIVELGPPQAAAPSGSAAAQPPVAAPSAPPASSLPPAAARKTRPAPRARNPQPPLVQAPQPSARNEQPADLSAMIAARRAQRAETQTPAETPLDPGPAGAAAPGAQGNEIALENIQRSLKQGRGREGTSGLFRILHKGPRNASFSFRGWSTDSSKRWNQVIEVDAGPNGDVEHTIVRKMIELIRQHHLEDFYWESQRLGRVVKLSTRPQDSAGLEDFLMQEFFGNG